MKLVQIFSVLLVGFLMTACHSGFRSGIDPRPEVKASASIADSFNVADVKNGQPLNQPLNIDQSHVVILKSALNKEFLLSVNMLSQTPTPMFAGLQSRVVSFILRDQKVYLVDVTKNNLVGVGNIPQNLLLAEFPILNQTEQSVTIDFNQGMKQIFTVSELFGSDDPGYAGANYKLPTSQIRLSYLDEVKLQENALFIRQVAQVEVTDSNNETTAQPVEVRYQIKPYLPDPSFVPVLSPGFSKVGYFEANPLILNDGSTRLYAMKWNSSQPIRFAISANTPTRYRELVKSSLLYWNKILGENVVQVTQLEDSSITAPNFDLNIIQWADWNAAGYAFADAQVDPRSGQVTSAQIFFPSAFTEANVAKRVRLTQAGRPVFGLKGFTSSRLCERNLFKDLATSESVSVSPEAQDKAMRDYVYEVIAHEMGHVLGLRHNFAGSLAANYDFKDRKDLIMSYYTHQKAPEGIIASSSVMEYSRFEESAWNGDRFQNGGDALAYDQMAMKYLYFKIELPTANRPIFCTDSDISVYSDCNMSDAGRSIVSSATGAYQFNLKSLAARLVNLYISKSKLADESGVELIPVSEVDLNAKSIAKTLGNDLAKLMSLMKVGTQLIAVRSPLVPVQTTNQNEVQTLEKTYLQNEVNRLGGLTELLQPLPQSFDTDLIANFSALLEDPLYNSGFLANGQTYSFTDAEKELMKKNVALFATQVKQQFILNEIKALSGESFGFEASYGQSAPEEKQKWVDSALTSELAPLLLDRLNLYAFDKTQNKLSSEITLKDGTTKKIELPVYTQPQNIRLAATTLLSNGHEAVEWGFIENQKSADVIKDELSLLGETDTIDFSKLQTNTLKWILNNKQLESALSN